VRAVAADDDVYSSHVVFLVPSGVRFEPKQPNAKQRRSGRLWEPGWKRQPDGNEQRPFSIRLFVLRWQRFYPRAWNDDEDGKKKKKKKSRRKKKQRMRRCCAWNHHEHQQRQRQTKSQKWRKKLKTERRLGRPSSSVEE
jgi:hypothetical protein